tara:strand:- start:105 stop:470 length:366 start_codon:yes stop_codon:yes gene_type:complete
MKTIALAALTAATALATPAMAGPYVTGSAEFTGSEGEYKNRELLARVGYDTTVGNLTPYVELGGGSSTDDGDDGEGVLVIEVGSGIDITEKLSANAFYEHKKYKSGDDPEWKIALGTKYRF